METEVAFSGDRHAERTMGEHFDFHESARRTADPVAVDDGLDFLDLSEIKFTCKDDDVGKLCVETQSLDIGDAELGGDVYLHTYLAGIDDGRHV